MTSPIKTWRVTYVETRCHTVTVKALDTDAAETIAEQLAANDEGNWQVKCIAWHHHETEEVVP